MFEATAVNGVFSADGESQGAGDPWDTITDGDSPDAPLTLDGGSSSAADNGVESGGSTEEIEGKSGPRGIQR